MKAMNGTQLAISVILDLALRTQEAAALVQQAHSEGREVTREEIASSRIARDADIAEAQAGIDKRPDDPT